MSKDAGGDMKARLRADLRAALKEGRDAEVRVIRQLIAAIDNGEAPVIGKARNYLAYDEGNGPTEVERIFLDEDGVHRLLLEEIHERERAAQYLEQLGKTQNSKALQSEALLVKRYLATFNSSAID